MIECLLIVIICILAPWLPLFLLALAGIILVAALVLFVVVGGGAYLYSISPWIPAGIVALIALLWVINLMNEHIWKKRTLTERRKLGYDLEETS